MFPKASTEASLDLQLSLSSPFKNIGKLDLMAWLLNLLMMALLQVLAAFLTYSF